MQPKIAHTTNYLHLQVAKRAGRPLTSMMPYLIKPRTEKSDRHCRALGLFEMHPNRDGLFLAWVSHAYCPRVTKVGSKARERFAFHDTGEPDFAASARNMMALPVADRVLVQEAKRNINI